MSSNLDAAWDRLRAPRPAAERPDADAPLTDDERDVLDFEARYWPRGGQKLAAIRERYGWSETRYYQVLRGLLDRPAAAEYSPALVRRLRNRLHAGLRR